MGARSHCHPLSRLPVEDRIRLRAPEWGYDVDDRCWAAIGGGPKGYVNLSVDGRKWLLHRLAYSLYVGDPAGMLVCHHCDNPRCVRPSHLFLGTHADNTADMMSKGRQVSERRLLCGQGHPITDTGPRGGRRRCLVCHRESERRRKEARSSELAI